MTYATDEQVELAESLGYSVDCNTRRGHRFQKGSRHVWATYQGWQTADIITGRFINHRSFKDLEDALRRDPLTFD